MQLIRTAFTFTQSNPPKSKVAANLFRKDPTERHLSFQERKKAFIEAARQ